MTISTTASRISYNGNGVTTIFAFPYRFLANGDLVVVSVSSTGVETTNILTTDYTLSGAGDDAGGSVTMLVAPAAGTRLVIYRDTDIVQETDYISGDPFPAETHERALDRLTMIAQEIGSDADRAIKVPVGDSDSLSTTLPAAANRLDKFIVFDATTGEMDLSTFTQSQMAAAIAAAYASGSLAVSSYVATLLDDATAEEARQTLGVVFMASSIAALKAFAKTPGATAVVYGYYAAGDGGGGVYWYDASDTTSTDNGGSIIVASDGGRWKIAQSFPMSLKQWGAKGDGTTDDTARIQAAIDSISAPGGKLMVDAASVFKITSTLTWGNGCWLAGYGSDSIIKGASMTTPLLQSKGGTTSRRYRLCLSNFTIDNTSRAAVGGIACDLRNSSDCVLQEMTFSNVEIGVQLFADTGLGCYYNVFIKCAALTCGTGFYFGQLANENVMYACRCSTITTGVVLADGSHNHLNDLSIENFTTGININGPAYDTQIVSPRLENAPTSGTGILQTGATVRTAIVNPQYTGLTTNLNIAVGQGTTINGRQRVVANLNFPSIAAGATADLAVTVAGATTADSVQVTPPSTLGSGLVCIAVPSTGQHYVRVANVTAGAIDPPAADFTLDIWRKE